MKHIIAFSFLVLSLHFTFGQRCGVFFIKYVGEITSDTLIVIDIKLPTTSFLLGDARENSSHSFVDVALINGKLEQVIGSELGAIYTDKDHLLLSLKRYSPNLKLKVQLLKNGVLEWETIEIEWDKIAVSTMRDSTYGNLFKFNLGKINI